MLKKKSKKKLAVKRLSTREHSSLFPWVVVREKSHQTLLMPAEPKPLSREDRAASSVQAAIRGKNARSSEKGKAVAKKVEAKAGENEEKKKTKALQKARRAIARSPARPRALLRLYAQFCAPL